MFRTPTTTSVLLVEEHPFTRERLRTVLGEYEDVQVVGEARDGGEAIQYVRMLKPHVILMDISKPQTGGVEATRVIKEEDPETIIIGLGDPNQDAIPQALLQAGASTCLDKNSIAEELYPTMTRCLESSTLAGLPKRDYRPNDRGRCGKVERTRQHQHR